MVQLSQNYRFLKDKESNEWSVTLCPEEEACGSRFGTEADSPMVSPLTTLGADENARPSSSNDVSLALVRNSIMGMPPGRENAAKSLVGNEVVDLSEKIMTMSATQTIMGSPAFCRPKLYPGFKKKA